MDKNKKFFKDLLDSRIQSVREFVNKTVDRIDYEKSTDSFAGIQSRQETDIPVYPSETQKFRLYIKSIEDVLLFKVDNNFTRMLEDCFDNWADFEYSLENFRRTEYIRKAYYRENKIYDLIKKINETTALLDTINNVQAVKEVVYNTCILNLKICIDEMKEKHAEYNALPPFNIDKSINNVIIFIKTECTHIGYMESLYKAYKTGIKLNEALETKKYFGEEEIYKFRELAVSLEEFRYGCRDLSDMEKVAEYLKKKNDSNIAEFQKIRRLYEKLTETFTDKWFKAADYNAEDSAVNLYAQDKLKDFYDDYMAQANGIAEEFVKS